MMIEYYDCFLKRDQAGTYIRRGPRVSGPDPTRTIWFKVGGIIMKENYRPYLETVQSVLAETASAENGLSGAEAAARLEKVRA